MAQEIRTFSKGMNKDISDVYLPSDQYRHAENLRLVTDEGGTGFSLETIKGTTEFLELPCTSPVVEVKLIYSSSLSNGISFPFKAGTKYVNISFYHDSSSKDNTIKNIVNALNDSEDFKDIGLVAGGIEGDSFKITSIKESVQSFEFHPALFETNVVVPYLCNLVIIGWKATQDSIILFSTSKDDPGYGQLWRLEYDIETLKPKLTLLYNNQLNFSVDYPISRRQIVVRYENENIERVYWTDDNNPFRSLNIRDPDAIFYNPDVLSVSPSIVLKPPVYVNSPSGDLPSNSYQFAYRLKKAGNYTPISPLSQIIPTNNTHLKIWQDLRSYRGTQSGTSGSASIVIRLEDLDTRYDDVEIFVVVRSDSSESVIKVKTLPIPPSGEMEFKLAKADLDNGEQFTLEELTMSSSASPVIFTHCKTIEEKDNILFAGNTKVSTMDFEYDARTYRYDKHGNQSPEVGYNQDFADDNAYLYQKDGVTVGGEGPNISYEIKCGKLVSDVRHTGNSTRSEPWSDTNFPEQPFRQASADNVNQYQYTGNNGFFPNFVNPEYEDNKGYMHDETYRFGIVFYDKRGVPGFARWIGDIRMPTVYDSQGNLAYPITTVYQSIGDFESSNFSYKRNDFNNNFKHDIVQKWSSFYVGLFSHPNNPPIHAVHPIYLTFKVNIPGGVASQISGFSIVRVKRNDSDRTVFMQGIISSLYLVNYGISEKDDSNLTTKKSSIFEFMTGSYEMVDDPAYYSFGYTNPVIYRADKNCVGVFPVILMGQGISFFSGDKIRVLCGLRPVVKTRFNMIADTSTDYGDSTNSIPTGTQTPSHVVLTKQYASFYDNDVNLNYGILDSSILPLGSRTGGSDLTGIQVNDDVGNFPLRNGGLFMITYSQKDPITNDSYPTDLPTLTRGGYKQIFLRLDKSLGAGYGNDRPYYLVNYSRTIPKQYGGNSEAERALNKYISTNHFQAVSGSGDYSGDVYGGDVYCTDYDYMPITGLDSAFPNVTDADPSSTAFNDDNLTYSNVKVPHYYNNTSYANYSSKRFEGAGSYVEGVIFPCEMIYNAEMRHGKTFNITGIVEDAFHKHLDHTDIQDSHNVWGHYYLENDIKKFEVEPFRFKKVEKHFNRIYHSKVKINGEDEDGWKVFDSNSFKDADGVYGGINALLLKDDKMFMWQDKAMGIVSINPRAVLNSNEVPGEVVIGVADTDNKIDKIYYLSTETGCRHQWSIEATDYGIYWFDGLKKKIYKYQGGAISDIKGMQAFMFNNVKGKAQILDKPLTDYGVVSIYDHRFNEVLFTFKDYEVVQGIYDDGTFVFDCDAFNSNDYGPGDSIEVIDSNGNVQSFSILFADCRYYSGESKFVFFLNGVYFPFNNGDTVYFKVKKNFTLVYSEMADAFTSFYSIVPSIWISDNKIILAQDSDFQSLWLHNSGNYSKFFDKSYDVKLHTVFNKTPAVTKVFDNLLWHSVSFDSDSSDLSETFDEVQFKTDYQDSGIIIVDNNNARRKERMWNMAIPRDNATLSRMRDKYMNVILTYKKGKYLKLHTISSLFRESKL